MLESLEVGNLPPSLKSLVVHGCPKLKSIAERLDNNTSLEKIGIADCGNLKTLPSGLHNLRQLREIRISLCSKLESIAEMLDNNSSLETIRISRCGNLKNLPSGLHNLRQLQEIRIYRCGNLVSFPEGGLPCAKLTRLEISDCKRLEALPKGLRNVSSLQQLTIGGALPSPEEDGLPTNLQSLDIWGNMEIWKSMIERGRGFHRFSFLRHLTISGYDDDMVSFPLEDKRLGTAISLPASLTSLSIYSFPNLERLSSSIVDLQNLTELRLSHCPKLKYFPEKGLPSSLLRLIIHRCPLIAEKCRKDGGQYWDLLTHISCVEMDGKWVFW